MSSMLPGPCPHHRCRTSEEEVPAAMASETLAGCRKAPPAANLGPSLPPPLCTQSERSVQVLARLTLSTSKQGSPCPLTTTKPPSSQHVAGSCQDTNPLVRVCRVVWSPRGGLGGQLPAASHVPILAWNRLSWPPGKLPLLLCRFKHFLPWHRNSSLGSRVNLGLHF